MFPSLFRIFMFFCFFGFCICADLVRRDATVTEFYPIEESNVRKSILNSTHLNETLDVIETSCKIVTEKLVSTAKASVTSSLSHICKTGEIKKQLDRFESKLLLKVSQLQTTLLALVSSNNNPVSYHNKFKFSVPTVGHHRGDW